jgi:hypothetical protein
MASPLSHWVARLAALAASLAIITAPRRIPIRRINSPISMGNACPNPRAKLSESKAGITHAVENYLLTDAGGVGDVQQHCFALGHSPGIGSSADQAAELTGVMQEDFLRVAHKPMRS